MGVGVGGWWWVVVVVGWWGWGGGGGVVVVVVGGGGGGGGNESLEFRYYCFRLFNFRLRWISGNKSHILLDFACSWISRSTCLMCHGAKASICLWDAVHGSHRTSNSHDDVIKWKHFPRYWPLVRGIHRSPVNSSQRPVPRSFDVFFDLCLNEPLSKQWRGRWFETPPRSLWRHC